MPQLKQTPLYQEHLKLKARMVPFGGWNMPVQYSGVIQEHDAVRNRAGLFDISHMGEIFVCGPKSKEFLHQLLTNDINAMTDGRCQYNLMCYENGTLVDDVIVNRISATEWLVVVNASNIQKDHEWMLKHKPEGVRIDNQSDDWVLLAIQGPKSVSIVKKVLDQDFSDLVYYHFRKSVWDGQEIFVSRTGYTGEDGFEIFLPQSLGASAWQKTLVIGAEFGLLPIGLAARDTLRLEAAYSLYGHEISDSINALEANLGWVVKFDKGDFIGKAALQKIKAEGLRRKIVGFEMIEAGIAREGFPVFADGQEIGRTTSGTHSPTLKKSIGLALIDARFAKIDGAIQIGIREQKKRARIVKTPFYKKCSA